MNMNFKRKLPIPKEIKEMYPISESGALAKEKGLSLESAAREARYGVFETLLKKNVVDKIKISW